ncbi:MAG: DoxX family membrane protein [Cyclobacteriaceae bacterium]|nr:DoxX family membrane protein [Cyclobacteriaceae bacterium]
MNVVDKIIKWFVGLLFIFSGLVKLNDPMGTAIKMEEYFEVFATDISSLFHYLIPYSLPVGLFVLVLEVLLGVAVLINYKMRITSVVLLLLIVFFTFLTFYSAAFNKVTDCGCFGDAIPLNPWQSFYKDILLLVFSLYIYIRRTKFKAIYRTAVGSTLLLVVLLFSGMLAYYAIEHLPPIDFRPYKIGADIQKSMQPSEDFVYEYIMEKDGKLHTFTRYPTDTSYQFVEMVLLNPEAQPKITDYSVWNDEGDYTEETFEGAKLLILINDVKTTRHKTLDQIKHLVDEIKGDVHTIVLTSSDEASYENFRHEYQLALPYYFADGTVIKTMIRANPGLILMKHGVVLGKWHNSDIPDKEEIINLIR